MPVSHPPPSALIITESSTSSLPSNSPSSPFEIIEGIAESIADTLGIKSRLVVEAIKVAAIGGAFAVANTIRSWTFEYLKRNITVEAEFDSRDEAYTWLLSYLSESSLAKTTSRFTVATSVRSGYGSGKSSSTTEEDDAAGFGFNMPRVFFLPSPGDHLFPFNGRLLYISRVRPTPTQMAAMSSSYSNSQSPPERMTITLLGRSRQPLLNLIQSAAKAYIAKEKGRTIIYAHDGYGNWRKTRSRPVRPLESVVMERGVKVQVLRDVVEFLGSESWYANRGIPYRRGYLFYGPPGTGKTSFVSALAGTLRLNIYVISLSNRGLTDDNLIELMSMTPSRCVLLLEDIDAAFITRESGGGGGGGGVGGGGEGGKAGGSLTFSGLLNAIDGVAAQEGRILCMTTNHVDRLDPALIRPGRIDVQVLFDRASKWQAAELFRKFYGGISHEDLEAARVAKAIVEGGGSVEEDEGGDAEEAKLGGTAAPPRYQQYVTDDDLQKQVGSEKDGGVVRIMTGEHPSGPGANVLSPGELDALADKFAKQIPDKAFSMAQLQGYLMQFKYDPKAAVEKVVELANGVKPNSTATTTSFEKKEITGSGAS